MIEIIMLNIIFFLSLVSASANKTPTGILSIIGVNAAIPPKPNFCLTFTKKRFERVNFLPNRRGKCFTKYACIKPPKYVKTTIPIMPPITLANEPSNPRLAAIAVSEHTENLTVLPIKTRSEDTNLPISQQSSINRCYKYNALFSQKIQNEGGISLRKCPFICTLFLTFSVSSKLGINCCRC